MAKERHYIGRDGKRILYNLEQISDSIYRAMDEGEKDKESAEESANIIDGILNARYWNKEKEPELCDITDLVEIVLTAIGQAGTSANYIAQIEEESRRRQESKSASRQR
jgi:anaerobic ribonucleoside-triphosphate reductase